MFEKIKKFLSLQDIDEEMEEESGGEESSAQRTQPKPRATIISLPSAKKQEIMIQEPLNFADAQEVADNLKVKKSIIINLRRTDKDMAKRIVDFLSGISYALDGHIQKVSENIFLFTPSNIDISIPLKKEIELGEEPLFGNK
ncbi:MAG: cell division protein SepF [Firmicutes bacterium]|nr:cell division protein SepF [Bacillota bacterium]